MGHEGNLGVRVVRDRGQWLLQISLLRALGASRASRDVAVTNPAPLKKNNEQSTCSVVISAGEDKRSQTNCPWEDSGGDAAPEGGKGTEEANRRYPPQTTICHGYKELPAPRPRQHLDPKGAKSSGALQHPSPGPRDSQCIWTRIGEILLSGSSSFPPLCLHPRCWQAAAAACQAFLPHPPLSPCPPHPLPLLLGLVSQGGRGAFWRVGLWVRGVPVLW